MQSKRIALAAPIALIALLTIWPVRGGESSYIYVYADPQAAASSWQRVSCDGIVVAKIKRGNFFALSAAPGRHALAIADGVPTFVIVEPNRDAYLRLDEHVMIGEPRVLMLALIAPELARKDMRWLLYIPTKRVVANTVSMTDPRPRETPRFKSREKD